MRRSLQSLSFSRRAQRSREAADETPTTLNNVCGIIRPVSGGPERDERPGIRRRCSRALCGLKKPSRSGSVSLGGQTKPKRAFPGPPADKCCGGFLCGYFINGGFSGPGSLPAGGTGSLPPFAGASFVCLLCGLHPVCPLLVTGNDCSLLPC